MRTVRVGQRWRIGRRVWTVTQVDGYSVLLEGNGVAVSHTIVWLVANGTRL
jgi:hypothetical protein